MAGDQFAALRCESVSAINTVGDRITRVPAPCCLVEQLREQAARSREGAL